MKATKIAVEELESLRHAHLFPQWNGLMSTTSHTPCQEEFQRFVNCLSVRRHPSACVDKYFLLKKCLFDHFPDPK